MSRFFSVLVVVVLAGAGLFFLRSEETSVHSPIPEIFGVSSEKVKVLPENNWFPKNSTFDSLGNLELSAKSAILVNYESGEIVFAKNINEKLPAASTIKIMTALIALEASELDDVFRVSEKAAKVGENSMGLIRGEKLKLRNLLIGLILVSGNDSAVTISEGVSGTEDDFVALMNKRASEIGLKNSKFINSSGLDIDGVRQFTTVFDMATLVHYLWENHPYFRTVSATVHKYIQATDSHKDYDLYSDTNLLTTYPGVKGIKPGFTWEAGLCLVTYAENNGVKLIGVILGSDDRRGEMKELLDFGFGSYGINIPSLAES